MTIEPIAQDHPCHGKVLATLDVFNPGGECSVRFTPEGLNLCQQLDEGHLMLDLPGQDRVDDAIASVSIKSGTSPASATLYSERLVPELAVGQYDLVAACFMRPQSKPSTSPRP